MLKFKNMNKISIFVIIILVITISYFLYNKYMEQNNSEEKNLKIEVLQEGTGDPAQKGDKLTVHYTGWLEDGTKFDSSFDRDNPFVFTLGIGQVIEGWDKGMLNVKVGEKRKLTISSSLAYGKEGREPIIPPNSTLIFEIEVINIQ